MSNKYLNVLLDSSKFGNEEDKSINNLPLQEDVLLEEDTVIEELSPIKKVPSASKKDDKKIDWMITVPETATFLGTAVHLKRNDNGWIKTLFLSGIASAVVANTIRLSRWMLTRRKK